MSSYLPVCRGRRTRPSRMHLPATCGTCGASRHGMKEEEDEEEEKEEEK